MCAALSGGACTLNPLTMHALIWCLHFTSFSVFAVEFYQTSTEMVPFDRNAINRKSIFFLLYFDKNGEEKLELIVSRITSVSVKTHCTGSNFYSSYFLLSVHFFYLSRKMWILHLITWFKVEVDTLCSCNLSDLFW